MVIGDPMDEETQMGPLVSAEHFKKVEGLLRVSAVTGRVSV